MTGLRFELVSDTGEGPNKVWTYSVEVEGEKFEGVGRSKKLAKQEASKYALIKMFNILCVPGKMSIKAQRRRHIDFIPTYLSVFPLLIVTSSSEVSLPFEHTDGSLLIFLSSIYLFCLSMAYCHLTIWQQFSYKVVTNNQPVTVSKKGFSFSYLSGMLSCWNVLQFIS